MTDVGHALQDLNDAIARGSSENRAKALWHATDILVGGEFGEDEIRVFGEVIARLTDEIEEVARAELSRRLAHSNNAPAKVVQMLAFDDSIEVAGPVLQFSPRLDAKSLIANIRCKGQPHLLAISRRPQVPVEVTDELVTRGNQEVVQSVVGNTGARFSDFGFRQMIKRAETDTVLAERVGLRKEIPPQLFRVLIARATGEVRRKLERERPELTREIQASVNQAASKLYSKFGPGQESYLALKQTVAQVHKAGKLNERSIAAYALAHKFEEAVIGLSLLSSLPVDVVEQMLLVSNRDLILVLSKALEFSWDTAMALLFLGAENHRIASSDLDELKSEFKRADIRMSRGILEVYQAHWRGRDDAKPASVH
ncbi:MAG TPA: DUF2336 domain-containing protein [Bradyrhizobium sp.]|uniref:DUF2336 domain-containing protein n=1 Tax=Bradyrhizobium sp. TaxID=376 RepID=UPI002D7EBE25|nr:DUF2336 domain-containing protein [Bradyrhizobium sp.]HET7889153.1 DUF2336 domain-containing protein [Bradyrhizobium sp.]